VEEVSNIERENATNLALVMVEKTARDRRKNQELAIKLLVQSMVNSVNGRRGVLAQSLAELEQTTSQELAPIRSHSTEESTARDNTNVTTHAT